MIDARELTRAFGEFRLGPISLRLSRGDYWVILGPSGAGKSMLLQVLAGIHLPDAGDLLLAGQDATSAPPETRKVGMVFQQSALFPHLSVVDNIGYGLWARRVALPERKRRIEELLAALRIESLVGRPVATLSGGEAQKVAIARALAPRPEILLLDEPLGPIDHNARLELQEELKRIHRAFALTTVHVTHSRDEATTLSDHCAVMLDGRIVQSGPRADLFQRPRCLFVAHFLGADETPVRAPTCKKSCITSPGRCDLPEPPTEPSRR